MIKLLEDIKIYFESRKKFLARRDEVEKLIKENERLTKDILSKATPELVLQKIMGRGIAWYDFNTLNPNQKRSYYNNIQAVITNESFINEINHLIADQVEYIARQSKSHEETMNVRMTINAVYMIKERLESIPDPRVPEPTAEEIHEAI
jgi:hypothetical protein